MKSKVFLTYNSGRLCKGRLQIEYCRTMKDWLQVTIFNKKDIRGVL